MPLLVGRSIGNETRYPMDKMIKLDTSGRPKVYAIVKYPPRILCYFPDDLYEKNYKVPMIQGRVLLVKLNPLLH